jgi:exodeoxyribonuclease-3
VDRKEFSWYSPAGNGFRIDHVFSTKEFDKNISYVGNDHAPRLEGETDHSALITECNNLFEINYNLIRL